MRHRLIATISTTLILALAGCGDSSQDDTDKDQGSAMDAVKENAQAAMDSASEAGKQAMEAASGAAEIAKEKGAEMAVSAQAQAQPLIDQVKTYLAENNIASAQDVIDKLVQLKDQLSMPIRKEIEHLQAQLAELRGQGDNAPASD